MGVGVAATPGLPATRPTCTRAVGRLAWRTPAAGRPVSVAVNMMHLHRMTVPARKKHSLLIVL